MVIENFLHDMGNNFTTNETLEVQKVNQPIFYLRDDADKWWKTKGKNISTYPNFN